MTSSDERESNIDERESNIDDVEAHGNLDRPVDPAPEAARDDEGDDVEAHYLGESPNDA
jgi:hypothetical protein